MALRRRLLSVAVALGVAAGVSFAPAASAQALAAPEPECPPTLTCTFIPAAYQNNYPADPVDWGNYDKANRPKDGMAINSVVVHDTEGNLEEVLKSFQDPTFYVACHYVIAPDGTVYQMVRLKDVAWHAANWWYNMHSVCIEHVGFSANGQVDYTPAMYRSSATLTKWLAGKFKFPLDREHVIGHDNVPATDAGRVGKMHTDPGPFWDWQKYMALMGKPLMMGAVLPGKMVTIAPTSARNVQSIEGCGERGPCVPAGPQPVNFVYLRVAPRPTAALISDPVTGAGTININNVAARAYYGQTFVVHKVQQGDGGLWYQVWYNGQLAWFHSPANALTAYPATGKYVVAKKGKASVRVFGRPLPEKSEYPADFVPAEGAVPYPTPMPYTIPAGHKYALALDSGEVTTDHFYSWTYDARLPYDHTVFKGKTKYLGIWYNGRMYFVRKCDVEVKTIR